MKVVNSRMINKIIKKFTPLLQKIYLWYSSKTRNYSYKNIKIIVLPGVFYPGFFKSTRIFLKYIEKINLSGKKVLELGAGSGIISILSAMNGAVVTASDINPIAIENINQNAQMNGVQILTIYSDLFSNISEKNFDFIFINPPYYNKEPKNISETAWFCGEQFEFFVKFFEQLKDVWHAPLSV
jgi:release factor glutamine methyltransferase